MRFLILFLCLFSSGCSMISEEMLTAAFDKFEDALGDADSVLSEAITGDVGDMVGALVDDANERMMGVVTDNSLGLLTNISDRILDGQEITGALIGGALESGDDITEDVSEQSDAWLSVLMATVGAWVLREAGGRFIKKKQPPNGGGTGSGVIDALSNA